MGAVHSRLYVIMGVAGSGKTTIGAALARALATPFLEGDDVHPPANVQRMAQGIPLTDDDRRPWLLAIAQQLRDAHRAGLGLVVTCSALKRSYRDLLRSASGAALQFVHLTGDRDVIAERLAERRGHFMPTSLLDSQLATLEVPAADERAWVCDIRESPEAIVANLVKRTA
jgi:gluconokinase